MLLSLKETHTPTPQGCLEEAMWVVMVELIPLGFAGCQKHDAAIMSPIDQFLKDKTGL